MSARHPYDVDVDVMGNTLYAISIVLGTKIWDEPALTTVFGGTLAECVKNAVAWCKRCERGNDLTHRRGRTTARILTALSATQSYAEPDDHGLFMTLQDITVNK